MAVHDLTGDIEEARRRACARCHTCFAELTSDDWCRECRAFRRYYAHGYSGPLGEAGGDCEAAAKPTRSPCSNEPW